MPRYLKVRGKAGVLVAHPYALGANPRRYAGQRSVTRDPMPREHAERYEPCEDVLVDEPSLRKAAKRGEIEILSEGEGQRADAVTWRERPQAAPVAPAEAEPAEQPEAPAEAEQAPEPAPALPEHIEEQPAAPEPEKENG